MSESGRQREESPLHSERGVTTISDTVVSQVAGMAAQEVEGVHMGGGTSRTASGVLGSITGSESRTSGVSVEVGRTEAAIDLKMGIEYNKNILQTVEEVRRRITDRVEGMTGLRIKELNATITDIAFPEKEARRRLGSRGPTGDDGSEDATDTASEAQTTPVGEPETTEVEPTNRTHTEDSGVPEEVVGVEDRPPGEDETAEVQHTDQAPEASEETQQTTQETSVETETTQEARAEPETPEEAQARSDPETPDSESAEERMRRRAEERAKRRRERSQDS